jgi:hypothetical protein
MIRFKKWTSLTSSHNFNDLDIFHRLGFALPITVAVRPEACTIFVHSNAGIVGSNPNLRHGCLCVLRRVHITRARARVTRYARE